MFRITATLVVACIIYFLVIKPLSVEDLSITRGNTNTPNISRYVYDVRFATDVVNIRSQPNTTSPVLSQLIDGDEFYVLEEVNSDVSGSNLKGSWLKVPLSHRGGAELYKSGFVYSKFTSKETILFSQKMFCYAINKGEREYFYLDNAPDYFEKSNDMRAIVENRAKQIYNSTRAGKVKYWEGIITNMTSAGGVTISFPDCSVKLKSGTSFRSINYTVKSDKELYGKLKGYQVGSSVIFSGEFDVLSKNLVEASFTTDGEMSEPEFPFKITAIHSPRSIIPAKVSPRNPKFSIPFFQK